MRQPGTWENTEGKQAGPAPKCPQRPGTGVSATALTPKETRPFVPHFYCLVLELWGSLAARPHGTPAALRAHCWHPPTPSTALGAGAQHTRLSGVSRRVSARTPPSWNPPSSSASASKQEAQAPRWLKLRGAPDRRRGGRAQPWGWSPGTLAEPGSQGGRLAPQAQGGAGPWSAGSVSAGPGGGLQAAAAAW